MAQFGKTISGSLWVALLGVFCLVSVRADASDLRVLLVLSDSTPIYQNFAQTFQQGLTPAVRVDVMTKPEDAVTFPPADLVVSVGMRAGMRMASLPVPMLAAMIPSHQYSELKAKRKRGELLSAVFVDQPWSRQIEFIRAALPAAKRIGVLYSTGSHLDIDGLKLQAQAQRYRLNLKSSNSMATLFGELEELLEQSDVLLAVPDATVYSSTNVRNILLSSYRHGVPLIGLSQGYVNAGALCAVFSSPEQIAAQAREITLEFARKPQLPDAQYPAMYSVATNQEVARTLKLTLKSAESLQIQLVRTAGGRDFD